MHYFLFTFNNGTCTMLFVVPRYDKMLVASRNFSYFAWSWRLHIENSPASLRFCRGTAVVHGTVLVARWRFWLINLTCVTYGRGTDVLGCRPPRCVCTLHRCRHAVKTKLETADHANNCASSPQQFCRRWTRLHLCIFHSVLSDYGA